MKKILFSILFIIICSCSNKDLIKHHIIHKEPKELSVNFKSELKPFYHGIASGDPLYNSVIIWTRVTPEYTSDIKVIWNISDNEGMKNSIQSGELITNQTKDYTVKVDVKNLLANKTYYYQFEALGKKSIIGKTKTTSSSNLDKLELAFASCSNYEWGYFNNYGLMADDKSLDAIVHLGDYIYEYGPGAYGDTLIGRKTYPKKEIVTLQDYRYRYSQYRTDENLMRAHKNHPFITIWDDHESANNSYLEGAENHQAIKEGNWSIRKNTAVKAYYEWMPIRDDKNHYREFTFGNLLNLFVLDTRFAGRTIQVENEKDPHYLDADRKIIGDLQFEDLMKSLNKKTKWKIIGNQVPFGPMVNDYKEGKGKYMDGWDGYPIERKKIVNAIQKDNIENLIIMTGDYHSSFAFETDLNGTKSTKDNIAVELIVPSINSANFNEYMTDDVVDMREEAFYKFNQHLKYVNVRDHGYVKLVIKKDEVKAKFLFSKYIKKPSLEQFEGKEFLIKSGKSELIEQTVKN